jgi:hypothetical protein
MTIRLLGSASPTARPVREPQSDFLRRSEDAWKHYLLTGMSVPASEVINRLQAALDEARGRLRGESAY